MGEKTNGVGGKFPVALAGWGVLEELLDVILEVNSIFWLDERLFGLLMLFMFMWPLLWLLLFWRGVPCAWMILAEVFFCLSIFWGREFMLTDSLVDSVVVGCARVMRAS